MGFNFNLRRLLITFCVVFASLAVARTQTRAPVIWDDAALADWATPIAALQIRPGHYTAAEYYSAPGENLRTYSVYHPDKEPPGYWESLQKKKPEPLVDVSKIRTLVLFLLTFPLQALLSVAIWKRTQGGPKADSRSETCAPRNCSHTKTRGTVMTLKVLIPVLRKKSRYGGLKTIFVMETAQNRRSGDTMSVRKLES